MEKHMSFGANNTDITWKYLWWDHSECRCVAAFQISSETVHKRNFEVEW